MNLRPDITIVVPCYNEEAVLRIFHAEMVRVRSEMTGVSFEIIFVDDGSTDNTCGIFRELHLADSSVRYLSFSRNFGKEAAMLAGLEEAKGLHVAVMDADLQDPPSLLPEMYQALVSGDYDCAATRRISRKGNPLVRSLLARVFYRIMSIISDADLVNGDRDFRLMSRKMVDAILSVREYNRFSKGIYSFVGFKTRWFEYENTERAAGETKWSFRKLYTYSLDGIMAFSTAPLNFASVAGFVLCLVAFAMIGVVVVKTILWGDPVAGYPSLMSVILFIGGIQLFSIGILGKYLAKTYLETKNRPPYIIRETSGEQDARTAAPPAQTEG
jgi:glycosyltransferase involved in cell wall biosynthesis